MGATFSSVGTVHCIRIDRLGKIGADRALKRLSLNRVGELPLEPAVTVTPGDDTELARERVRSAPFPYLLVVDADRRPLGWLPADRIAAQGHIDPSLAISMSPLLDRETTLKDALSMMLDADVQTGIVVDRDGRVQGLLTVEAIGVALRPESNPAVLAPSAAAAAS